MLNKGVVAGLCLALAAAAGPALGADAPLPGKGCKPSTLPAGGARAKVEADTRRVAMAFAKGGVEEQDRLLAPNALFWALGIGYLDRAQYIAMHQPKSGPVRSKPTSYKQTINYVLTEGQMADIDMEKYVVWPDFTYDQKYNILFQVQDGQICLLKIFSNSAMAKAMLPDIEKSVEAK
ncbi:MAG: hypothetical protein JWQ29_659 [Phenylobacterium sp.]|nr:hypothetical protein [Phenylobacterium sp.]